MRKINGAQVFLILSLALLVMSAAAQDDAPAAAAHEEDAGPVDNLAIVDEGSGLPTDPTGNKILPPATQKEPPPAAETKQDKAGLLYSTAVSALQQGNLTSGVASLFEAASEGSADAFMALGVVFNYGIGVPQSEGRAVLYEQFAALAGSAEGHRALAQRFYHGLGVKDSCHEAVEHIKHAADTAIFARMKSMPGELGLPKDITVPGQHVDLNSMMYIAERGDLRGQIFLGYSYLYGLHGAKRSDALAVKYFERAAEKGSLAAWAALGHYYLYGHKGDPKEDGLKAKELFERAGEQEVALNGLGYLYAQGQVVERDFEKASEYFERAAPNPTAVYNLAVLSLFGKGVPKDRHKAIILLRKAAQDGSTLARWMLGHVDHDDTEAGCKRIFSYFFSVVGHATSRVEEAQEFISKGQNLWALLHLLVSAEMRIVNAKEAAADLLDDMDLSDFGENETVQELTHSRVLTTLLRTYAVQGDTDAHLRLAHYFGDHGNFTQSIAHFHKASFARNPAALFYMGLFHTTGGDGVKRDFHLAKRYLEESLQGDKRGYLAVQLALFRLNVYWWWDYFVAGQSAKVVLMQFVPPFLSKSNAIWGLQADNFFLLVLVGLALCLLLARHHLA